MRIFLAVNLDHEMQEELIQFQEELKRKIKGIRWVNPQLLHITLKFLGETDEAVAAMLENPLRELAEKTAAFRVSLGRLGAFPSLKDPRVIWLGILEGATELVSLAEGMEEALKKVHPSHFLDSSGKSTRDKFRPHLTIGRKSKQEAFEADPAIFKERWECRNRLYVDSFYLIKSILRPTGPLYIPIQKFLLKKM